MKTLNIGLHSTAIIVLLLGLILLMQTSCKKELITDKSSQPSSKQSVKTSNFILGIDKTNGAVRLYTTTYHEIFLSEGGDIIIHKNKVEPIKIYKQGELIDNAELEKLINEHKDNKYILRSTRNTDNYVCVLEGTSIWPHGIVRIGIDDSFPLDIRENIFKAIEVWREKTNIGFEFISWEEATTNGDSTYKVAVHLQPNAPVGQAYATVGTHLGYSGSIMLAKGVLLHAIVHELGHTFGFIHEHQRPSRDNYMEFQRLALIELLPLLFNENKDRLDFNNIAGTANPYGEYYQRIVPAYILKKKVYSDDTTLAPFDCKSIMIYPSYGCYPFNDVLMQYNAPIYVIKGSNEVCGDALHTDPENMLSELDIRKVNTVYPLDI